MNEYLRTNDLIARVRDRQYPCRTLSLIETLDLEYLQMLHLVEYLEPLFLKEQEHILHVDVI